MKHLLSLRQYGVLGDGALHGEGSLLFNELSLDLVQHLLALSQYGRKPRYFTSHGVAFRSDRNALPQACEEGPYFFDVLIVETAQLLDCRRLFSSHSQYSEAMIVQEEKVRILTRKFFP
jgi:hypothetical protein